MSSTLKPWSFFAPLLITAIFAFLSASGVVKAEALLSEQLVPKTFELFAYISLALTGFLGAFHIHTKAFIFRFISASATWAANSVFGLAGSLVGWGVGILAATVTTATPLQFIAHTGIVCYMALMVLVPAWAFEQTIVTREVVAKEYFFRRNLYGAAIRSILFLSGGVGAYGFIQFWA